MASSICNVEVQPWSVAFNFVPSFPNKSGQYAKRKKKPDRADIKWHYSKNPKFYEGISKYTIYIYH